MYSLKNSIIGKNLSAFDFNKITMEVGYLFLIITDLLCGIITKKKLNKIGKTGLQRKIIYHFDRN
jgi:hypothetical protein